MKTLTIFTVAHEKTNYIFCNILAIFRTDGRTFQVLSFSK